ncbi:MAG: DNA mismatch repair protein MutS [Deltaproteobacteria bacterium]|nr:DNA mismatch repair protein MutS [Deltaproteobacteria bacterium]
MSEVTANTPMMQQFNALKRENPDCILFFRSGDFYEMFGRDAEVAAPILDIALTTRNKNSENAVAMAGVPHHAYETYLNKLTQAGLKVAIAEQMEEAQPGKGLVRREVVRVVTPGTAVSPQFLSADRDNFLAALKPPGRAGRWGLALADLSTGRFLVAEFPANARARLESYLSRLAPRELLLPEPYREEDRPALENLTQSLARLLGDQGAPPHMESLPRSWWDRRGSNDRLTRHFRVANLDGFGVGTLEEALRAAGALLAYLGETQKCDLTHITHIQEARLDQAMWLDEATLRNLEVFENPAPGGARHTLFRVLNKTRTPMGARALRQWLGQPLLNHAAVEERLDAVEELKSDLMALDKLREALSQVGDLERVVGRVALPLAGVADVMALRQALHALQGLPQHLAWLVSGLLAGLARSFDPMEDVWRYLQGRFLEDPALKLTEGGYIAAGVIPELDRLRELSGNSRQVIAQLEARERDATGIASLKVRFNRVFGYYIEVSRVNQDKVPDHYLRKQTLVNAERYTTPELEDLERQILGAEEQIRDLEAQEFQSVRTVLGGYSRRMQETAAQVGMLDALAALAQAAQDHNYRRPVLLPPGTPARLAVRACRHPVVERSSLDEPFIPNDLQMNAEERQILLITGPNMAGKSTVMRQTALLQIMAQTGSFVAAESAELTLADRVFTRVGASDNLARGQSTFMLEMNEAANILHHASPNSLIILDEIGRGTSTYDGISIAWAMAEYLHQQGPLTLFATHYHELTQLARELPRLKNVNIAIREEGDHLVFTRKLRDGEADKSYGIQVAKLAGLPPQVIQRAHGVMEQLVQGSDTGADQRPTHPPTDRLEGPQAGAKARQQLTFLAETSPVLEELRQAALDQMTPLEALNFLHRLRKQLDSG